MRIAIVLWELTLFGGTQRQALELAAELQKKGHEVDVFAYTYDSERTYADMRDQLRIYAVKNIRAIQHGADTSSSLKRAANVLHVYNLLLTLKVYGRLIKTFFVPEAPLYALKQLIEKTRPLAEYEVINLHDYEVYKLARVIRHPNIVWMLNDMQRTKEPRGSFLHRSFISLMHRLLVAREIQGIRTIAVMDNRNKRLCKEKYGRDSHVVRSGVDLKLFDGMHQERTWNKRTYALFASSIFFPHRRFEDLVDAIEILVGRGYSNFHLTINGIRERSYDYYLFVKQRIESKHLDPYVSLINGLSEGDLKRQYLASDIFIFPNTNQTWGLAIFEAMLAGCACIVSRGSGGHEVLTDTKNALLVDPQSPEQIADRIEFLMTHPTDMECISKQGVSFVKQNLAWDKYAQQMEEVFRL